MQRLNEQELNSEKLLFLISQLERAWERNAVVHGTFSDVTFEAVVQRLGLRDVLPPESLQALHNYIVCARERFADVHTYMANQKNLARISALEERLQVKNIQLEQLRAKLD